MTILREAYNDNCDNVMLTETVCGSGDVIYAVYLYNNSTKHTVNNFYEVIDVHVSEDIRKMFKENANTAFDAACDFMGVTEA